MVKTASRPIDPKHLARALKVEPTMVGPYLDELATELHIALDKWRFGKAPVDDVNLALDAFIALMAAAEVNGLTR